VFYRPALAKREPFVILCHVDVLSDLTIHFFANACESKTRKQKTSGNEWRAIRLLESWRTEAPEREGGKTPQTY
jgi:hypothetical protein